MIINIMLGTSRLGAHIIQALLDQGAKPEQLAASVRNHDRVKQFEEMGIKILYADYEDKASMTGAFEGADVLVLIPTFAHVEERILQHSNAIDASISSGVKRVVWAGFDTVSPDSKFWIAAFMAYAELKIRTRLPDWTICRDGRYVVDFRLTNNCCSVHLDSLEGF